MKIIVRNVEPIQAFLKEVPRGGLKSALRAIADYLLGDESHGLRHYEPYKYVKPFRSYSFDPEKAARQRRWIFANLEKIGKNNRTGATSAAWMLKETKGGYGYTFENKSDGAKWIWGDASQTRHQKAAGHRTVSNKIASNIKGAIREGYRAINKWLKENKPKG